MLDYLYYVGQDRTRTTSTQYAAHVSGELFELPAGPLAMAGGFEYRRDAGTSQLDAFKVAADNLGDNSYSGGLSVDEGFLELSLPLLADARFARALDLSLAARHSRYDAFGSTTNGEAGLQWRPHDDALLRASWSEGFRAPIVSELFFPIRATDGPSRNDPCAAANAITAERRAGCVADGVPGGAYVPTQSNFQVLSGGNDQLGPERAVSRTIGVVWSPSRWPDVDLSLDWYEIEVEDAIASPSVPVLLRSCVDSGIAEACARTTRSASGELQSVDARRLNSGLLAVEGWDLTARWRREARLGLFELVWDSTYTSRYDTEIPRGAPARSAVGNNVAREPGFRIRSNLDLAWRRGNWSAAAGVRWYSGLDEPCIGPVESGRSELCSHPDVVNRQFPPSPENRLGARTYVDLQASWAAPWGSQVSLGLNNAFDRDPPVSYSGVANSFDPTYPVPGRFWYLRLQHAW
jgi:iron complex outermembrane receptor protein